MIATLRCAGHGSPNTQVAVVDPRVLTDHDFVLLLHEALLGSILPRRPISCDCRELMTMDDRQLVNCEGHLQPTTRAQRRALLHLADGMR